MQLDVNGFKTHYELAGPDDAPVILFSHSLATDCGMWSGQSTFAGDYRLLKYDTRGHGKSDVPSGAYTLEAMADDACALIDALAIEKVHWVGISMGGMIGQAFALAHPQRLLSLSLCDTLCELPEAALPMWEDRIRTANEQGMNALVDSTIERWFSPEFAQKAAAVDAVRAMIRATPVAGYVGCSRAIMGLNFTDRLATVATPTWVVVGEDDPSTPVAGSEQIQRLIPGSRLTVIPGARHLSNIEQAEAFNAGLGDFLSDL